MHRFDNIRFELRDEINIKSVSEKTGAALGDIISWRLVKKSVDARKKSDVHFVCSFDISLRNEEKYKKFKNVSYREEEDYEFPKTKPKSDRPLIIGSGPAGLFAALMLAENGHRPILAERGESVSKRIKSVEKLQTLGILNPESNIQFGEGGAGTFSDGKLTTGIKNIRCQKILKTFVRFGAPEEILYLNKPHIGTDLLCRIVKNMREYIKECGGEVRFECRLERLIIKNGCVAGAVLNGEELEARRVILAIGHSARDTVRELFRQGVKMEAKPFSMGARIEHLQEFINESQYGESSRYLGAADYKLSAHLENGRGVYTFCMCPGGRVVCASSAEGMIATNGMSDYARDGRNANSALLTDVRPADFESSHPLAGIDFQEKYESLAFSAGGGRYFAPTQLVGDFLKNIPSSGAKSVCPTYLPGAAWGRIDSALPDFVCKALREGLKLFDKKIKGFAAADAVLTAPETRSSSPVRILRDRETFMSNIGGLYPCGEGAGYAGGIMSAAADGIACAEKVVGR